MARDVHDGSAETPQGRRSRRYRGMAPALAVLPALLLLAAVTAPADGSGAAVRTTGFSTHASCRYVGMCYDPMHVLVPEGGTVVMTNGDSVPHTFTGGYRGGWHGGFFDSGILGPGESFEWTAPGSGTYPYYCGIHPWMVGGIAVTDSEGTRLKFSCTYTGGVSLTDSDGTHLKFIGTDVYIIERTDPANVRDGYSEMWWEVRDGRVIVPPHTSVHNSDILAGQPLTAEFMELMLDDLEANLEMNPGLYEAVAL